MVNQFQKGNKCENESFIIPNNLSEITKPFIFVEIPYCELIEINSKHFLKKFRKFNFLKKFFEEHFLKKFQMLQKILRPRRT